MEHSCMRGILNTDPTTADWSEKEYLKEEDQFSNCIKKSDDLITYKKIVFKPDGDKMKVGGAYA